MQRYAEGQCREHVQVLGFEEIISEENPVFTQSAVPQQNHQKESTSNNICKLILFTQN